MKKYSKLSLCMIVKNEEEYLPDCLKSVQSLVDEMIIVDTGSSDKTIEIAESFGAKIIHHPWNDDFAEARNISLQHATCDWILVLDADEIIAEQDLWKIRKLIKNNKVAGYRLIQRTYQQRTHQEKTTLAEWQAVEYPCPEARGCSGYIPSPLVRLFRRDKDICFRGRVHELVEYAILEKAGLIVETDIPIHHYGKICGEADRKQKAELYRLIGEKKVKDNLTDARAHCDLGVQYIELEMYDKAEWALQKAVEIAPENVKALFNLGVCLAAKNETWRAIEYYRMALKYDPKHMGAYNNLAVLLKKEGRMSEIKALYQEAISHNPRHYIVRYNFGTFLKEIGEITGAIEQYKSALEIEPDFVDTHYSLGVIYWRQGLYQQAITHYQEVIRNRPDHASAHNNLGIVYESLGRFSEAIKEYQEAVRYSPDHITAHNNLGRLYLKLDNYEEAAREFNKVLAIDTDHPTARKDLETAHQKLEVFSKIQEARKQVGALRKIVDKREPTDHLNLLSLSLCMIVRDEEEYLPKCLNSVKSIVDEIVIVDTGSKDRTVEIAKGFGAKVFEHPWNDDFAEARNVSLRHATSDWILVLDADEVIARRDLSRTRELIKNKEVAGYRLILRNYEFNPNLSGWRKNEGDYEEGKGYPGYGISPLVRLFQRDSRALFTGRVHELVGPSLEQAGLKIADTDIPIHHYGKVRGSSYVNRKAQIYRRLGEKKAFEGLGDAKALADLGTQYIELGEMTKAEEVLRRALEIDPQRFRAYFDLGVLYGKQQKWSEALKTLLRAIELDPKDVSSRYNCGFVLEKLGKVQEAYEQYHEALVNNPDHVGANFNLGVICWERGDVEAAIKHYIKVIEAFPSHVSACNNLGVAYKEAGRFEDAIACYQKALELDPLHENARANLNRLLGGQEKLSESISIAYEQLRNIRRVIQKDLGKKKVVFYNPGIRFNGDTLRVRPLGGMESAIIYMARELARLDCTVKVFCNCDRPGIYDEVEYFRIDEFEKTMIEVIQ